MVISMLFDSLVLENKRNFQKESQLFSLNLVSLKDFYLEIKWEFHSNCIPFLSRFTPTGTSFKKLEKTPLKIPFFPFIRYL